MSGIHGLCPNEFNTIAQADVSYANLTRATWSQVDDTTQLISIDYDYDTNGSLTSKSTWEGEIDTGTHTEEITYEYNLQNRLAKVTTDTDTTIDTNTVSCVEYTYNSSGIRVRSLSYQQPQNGGAKSSEITTTNLIDPANPTGYAQVLEETIDDGSGTTLNTTTYTLGGDVIAQAKTDWTWNTDQWQIDTQHDTQYLLYDGHGSTRQLVDAAANIDASYSYDAYGVMLGGNPAAGSNPATNLLYSGEQFDTNAQQYYLRARYYNQNNGRFNRLDPYAGNSQDPQSLHKYLYCHANPVNNIDPSGCMSYGQMMTVAVLGALLSGTIGYIATGSVQVALGAAVMGFIVAPMLAMFTAQLGVLLAGVLAANGIIFSAGAGIFVVSSLMAMYFIRHTVNQMEKAETEREMLSLQIQLGAIIGGWLVCLAGLGKHYAKNWSRFRQVRSTYKPEAGNTEIKQMNQKMIEEGLSIEARAKRIHGVRQNARIAAREQMGSKVEVDALKVRDSLKFDTPDGPSFEYLVQKAKSQGLTGDAIYQSIIGSAARTSVEYNAAFGQGNNSGGG